MDNIDIWKIFGHIGKLHFLRNQRQLDELGLYPGQPPLLTLLLKKDGQSQREIAKLLMIKPATVNVMIKRMEKSGFLRKEQDVQDLRISRIFITDKGKDLAKKLCEIHKEGTDEYLRNFTEEEKEELYNLLCKIRDNIIKYTK